MLEEHSNIEYVEPTNDVLDNRVLKLGVHKCFAFWISLFMMLVLAPLLFYVYLKDKQDIQKFGVSGNPFLQKYTLFCFLFMSIKQRTKDTELEDLSKKDSKFQPLGQTSVPTMGCNFDNEERKSIDLKRINTPGPQISKLGTDKKKMNLTKEENKEDLSNIEGIENSNVLEETNDEMNIIK